MRRGGLKVNEGRWASKQDVDEVLARGRMNPSSQWIEGETMQYTIQNVTDDIDAAARLRAQTEHKSLNHILLDALRRGFGIESTPTMKRDLSDVFDGTPLEPEVIEALEDQRRIDPELWK